MDFPDIPDFLKATPESTAMARAAWKPPKRPRKGKAKTRAFHLPKTIEPEGLVLLKQIEKEKAEKMKARFARLRELKSQKR